MEILGIDIGGSGIKGAPVNIETGVMVDERFRIDTPQPSTPDAVAQGVKELVDHFNWKGALGCTFPAIIKQGVAYSAANVDKSWIGTDGQGLIERVTGNPVLLINDADAAGIAEMRFGAGRGHEDKIVIMLTLGTGIGSAVFVRGHLFPNTELGHLQINGIEAEARASDRARQEEELGWKKWSRRLNQFLEHVDFLFSPDLFIIGGGVSKKFDKFFPHLGAHASIVPAQLRNDAGLVGAALAARSLYR